MHAIITDVVSNTIINLSTIWLLISTTLSKCYETVPSFLFCSSTTHWLIGNIFLSCSVCNDFYTSVQSFHLTVASVYCFCKHFYFSFNWIWDFKSQHKLCTINFLLMKFGAIVFIFKFIILLFLLIPLW